MLAIAFLVGTWIAMGEARRLHLDEDKLPSVALGTMFGRVGCFLNGCCYGRPTSLPWGVTFPPDSFAGLEFGNAKVHPSQLYFAAAGLLLFAVCWFLRTRIRVPGVLFWSF